MSILSGSSHMVLQPCQAAPTPPSLLPPGAPGARRQLGCTREPETCPSYGAARHRKDQARAMSRPLALLPIPECASPPLKPGPRGRASRV